MLFKAFPCSCETQVPAGVSPRSSLQCATELLPHLDCFLESFLGTGSVGQSVELVMSVAKRLHQNAGLIYAAPHLPYVEMPFQRSLIFIFRENVFLSFAQIFWSHGGSLTNCQTFLRQLPGFTSSPAARELSCFLRPRDPVLDIIQILCALFPSCLFSC